MTTVAADLKSMSCDSLVSWGERSFYVKKIIKYKGKIYGFAGDYDSVVKMIDWLKGNKKRRPKDVKWGDEFEGLVLSKQGLFYINPDFKEHPFNRDCFAIGSGSGPAMGAMMAGADSASAVSIACEIDPNSGGEIHTEFL